MKKSRNKAMHNYTHEYHAEIMEDSMIKSMTRTFYSNIDPRRRQEFADGGIVKEDDNAMANLPRQAIHHEYPKEVFYTSSITDQKD